MNVFSIVAETAAVHPDVRLGRNVEVGEYCRIEAGARIGDHTRIADRVCIGPQVCIGAENSIGVGAVIKGRTTLGDGNSIHEYCVVGGEPLVADNVGGVGGLTIGSSNVIREMATIQVGSVAGRDTSIGSRNFIMPHCQIGHDSRVGNHVTMTNYTGLCGHVIVEDRATLGMRSTVHQFCRIGELAMVGASAYISQDIPPFTLVDGRSGALAGLNQVGLRRAGFSPAVRQALKIAYRLAVCGGARLEFLEEVRCLNHIPAVAQFAEFIKGSERGVASDRRAIRRRAA